MTLFWQRGQPARSAAYAELLIRYDTHKVLVDPLCCLRAWRMVLLKQ